MTEATNIPAAVGEFITAVAALTETPEGEVIVMAHAQLVAMMVTRIGPRLTADLCQGTADRIRADHWPDPLVRQVAARYPAGVLEDVLGAGTSQPQDAPSPQDDPQDANRGGGGSADAGPRSGRTPRKPRKPRSPRTRAGASPSSSSSTSSGPASRGWVA